MELFATAATPLIKPLIDGLKVTLNVHLELGVNAPPQGEAPLPVAVKLALAPSEEIVTVPALMLVTVTVLLALVVPSNCPGKVRLAARNFRGAVAPPAPAPDIFAN